VRFGVPSPRAPLSNTQRADMRARQPNARGTSTRDRVLSAAVELSSVLGLEGLSLGHLAEQLGMSKAGVLGHFPTKDALGLAVIERAAQIFTDSVITPALAAPQGLPRLLALSDAWLSYAEREVFRGGCFFAAAAAELDGRPGPLRDAVVEAMRAWLALLAGAVRDGIDAGHLEEVDPQQIAFELQAFELAANWARQLFSDPRAVERARDATRARLLGIATRKGKRFLAQGATEWPGAH
jgi:AcrR family transcriptional regulator